MNKSEKKEKLQVCVSYKHTKEEEDLYMYTLDQGDKSVFIKNLIRAHQEGRILESGQTIKLDNYRTHKEEVMVEKEPKIQTGKKTRNKFLA